MPGSASVRRVRSARSSQRLCLLQPSLPDQRGAECHVGDAGGRLLAPAVPLGQLDRLPARAPLQREDRKTRRHRPVRQAEELEIGPPDPAGQGDALLQVPVRLLGPRGPDLGDAQADQGQRPQILAQAQPRASAASAGASSRCASSATAGRSPRWRASQSRTMASADLDASAPLRGHRTPLLARGPREVPLGLLQRSPVQFVGRHQRGELRVGRDRTGREPGEELMRGGALPVQVPGRASGRTAAGRPGPSPAPPGRAGPPPPGTRVRRTSRRRRRAAR